MRWLRARAKVNLTLHVSGRRPDGYHELESLVAFAGACDWLGYEPASDLTLEVTGPNADAAGPREDNLVLRAAREFASRVVASQLGHFRLIKRLPTAAGLGGGSADAAAALRALADANGAAVDDDRILAAAAATGADVPVCLASRARVMAGVGDQLCAPVALPRWFMLLVNPRVATATQDVFRVFDSEPAHALAATIGSDCEAAPLSIEMLAGARNDLEVAARQVSPVIGNVLNALNAVPGARLVRMSGSGSTCFALFDNAGDAATAKLTLAAAHPDWWLAATVLR